MGPPPRTRSSKKIIGEDEYGSRKVRFQRRLAVVAVQDSVLPGKQVGILEGELFPAGTVGASHPFADQEKIRAGDGLIVQLCFSPRGGKSLQGAGKFLER